jgi:hypothetical protein
VAQSSTQRALVIGVSDYPDPSKRLPAVAADVREMAKVLSSKNGTFATSGVTVLTDKEATRDKVVAKLHAAFVGTPADTTFVYLAGHGFEAGGCYYYVAYDTDISRETTAVPLVEIRSLFDQTRSLRTFLWLDFCHSGGILARGGSDDMDIIRRGIGVIRGEGRIIVAACTSAQQSYESDSIGHGFFTHALLRGLRGEAQSAQGEVTALSLYEFIDHQVANNRQQPVFFGETTGRIVLMHYRNRVAKKAAHAGPKPSRSEKNPAQIRGTWVMLGDDFFVAEHVRSHSDGTIELAVTPRSGEDQAALAALRPPKYGGGRNLAFAANTDACQVRVEQVVGETTNGKQVLTVKLRSVEHSSNFATEASVQGIGPDDIARRRIGRLILNDPPPLTSARSTGYDTATFIDGFISGAMTGFEIKECVVRSIYHQYGQSSNWKDFALLKAIFLMKITGTIEHVLKFTIGTVRGGKVSVHFRGRRPQRYSNVAPETIEMNGTCLLE